ncbi:hypothetical protein ACVDG3_08785 [Meridianimarinicoccus sp. RP-17]|uniref:hypothetical protein n=1 Tax=Meridianimarinicoccus zhengii TaxID=2056810 RepID=UPI000DACF409|nr:hypothetical protein [Phycocomes zhengii]
MTVRLKADDIRAAMAKRWSNPEWAIMWEVGEGTGAKSGRYADAVMMSLWPSRGLELHGVEIKVTRADWKREAADPSKAEAIARFCDRWWIHTPPGIVDDLSDLPPAWGLREFDGKAWKTIREADKTEAAQVSRPFLAAMLRRADGLMKGMIREAMREADEARYAEMERARAGIESRVSKMVSARTKDLERAAENVAAFEAAFGKGSSTGWSCRPEAWGAAAKALANVGATGYGPLAERLRKAADEIDALAALSRAADAEGGAV